MDSAQPREEQHVTSSPDASVDDIEKSETPSKAVVEKLDEDEAATNSDPSSLEAQQQQQQQQQQQKTTITTTTDSRPAYSAFSKYEKWFIVAMVTMATFFSPLSGQIYYPVMPTLVQSYHLTPALVNLTVTTYMILQGLAPSFMGTFADSAGGRRPAYILAFAIYTAANVGLALQDSYAALLVLRCLQSAGSSGTVAFGYGVIADISTTAERGKYIGPMAAGALVAPAMGPVIGGLLSQFLGWRSVFWFLVIISGGYLVAYVVLMPETARKVVGDGSVPPREWWRMSVVQYVAAARRRRKNTLDAGQLEAQKTQSTLAAEENKKNEKRKIGFPNPFLSFAILLERDALIIISYIGLTMFGMIALLTSVPNLFSSLYGFNDLQIGLCFIPLGASAMLAAILNGKLLDLNYRRTARRLGFPIDRKRGDDLRNFPIERARLMPVLPLITLGILAYIPYGWVLEQHTSLAVPLVLQFIMGFCLTASNNTLNTLLVDLFPDRPATASAACNLVRCWLGAVGAAVIDHMLSGMGWGWCFTFWGLVMGAVMPLLWVEMVWGMNWRGKRLERLERKKKEEEERQQQQQQQQ